MPAARPEGPSECRLKRALAAYAQRIMGPAGRVGAANVRCGGCSAMAAARAPPGRANRDRPLRAHLDAWSPHAHRPVPDLSTARSLDAPLLSRVRASCAPASGVRAPPVFQRACRTAVGVHTAPAHQDEREERLVHMQQVRGRASSVRGSRSAASPASCARRPSGAVADLMRPRPAMLSATHLRASVARRSPRQQARYSASRRASSGVGRSLCHARSAQHRPDVAVAATAVTSERAERLRATQARFRRDSALAASD